MNNKHVLLASLALIALTGMAAAQSLEIPAGQPICNLYSLIQLFATVGGVLVAAYAGFQLATTHDMTERSNAKMLLSGVVIGLIIVWIAPFLVKTLVGASNVCGW